MILALVIGLSINDLLNRYFPFICIYKTRNVRQKYHFKSTNKLRWIFAEPKTNWILCQNWSHQSPFFFLSLLMSSLLIKMVDYLWKMNSFEDKALSVQIMCYLSSTVCKQRLFDENQWMAKMEWGRRKLMGKINCI